MTAHAPDNANTIEEGKGDWAGWLISRGDPYERLSGPFYCRADKNGKMQTAFRVENKHLNNSGFVHGGCLMALGDMLEATGEVIRAAASLIFVRGLILGASGPILNFSAILKRVRGA